MRPAPSRARRMVDVALWLAGIAAAVAVLDLACSFWLVSALARNGRADEARALFERLTGLTNDLGLLAEEYDAARRRQVGNFPQAFSHLTPSLAAHEISAAGPAAKRAAS
jgi:hypothetical protein